jgi:TonB-linked SusC/RagA family outer membrane protein
MRRLLENIALGTAALLLLPVAALAQDTGTITGTVTDAETGETLPGSSVVLIGEEIGASVNSQGQYTLEDVPADDYRVQASFVGYENDIQEVTVQPGETVTLDFVLGVSATELEEVVVTGKGGATQRRNLTTSISSVDEEEVQSVPAVSAESALQGRVSGVQVFSSSGTPGGGISVRVRGATSVNGSNQPLYVVDGVPVASGSFTDSFTGGQSATNALSQIDLSTVASIEVLKGPAATAIYGTRAANGVVLITTDRGQAGGTRVSFEYSAGASQFGKEPQFLTGSEYIEIRNEGVRNQGFDQLPDATFNSIFPGTKEFPYGDPAEATDASGEVFDAVARTGFTQDAKLSLSGGNQSTRFLLSGSYTTEEGVVISQGFQRLGGTVNVDHTFADGRGQLSGSARYNRSVYDKIDNDNSIYGILTNAITSTPTEPVRSDDGTLNDNAGAFANPVRATRVKNQVIDTKFLGNVELSYELIDGLRARVSGGVDRFDEKAKNLAPRTTVEGSPAGTTEQDRFLYANYILESSLNYQTDFLGNQSIDAVVGASAQETNTSRVEASANTFPSDDLLGVVSTGATTEGSSSTSVSGLVSFYGKADYNYDSRYLLTLTGRVDGSSRFGENNRYAFFPAISAAYNIAEEPYADGFDALDQLKLRASVGLSGQQEIGNFTSQGLFTGGSDYAGRSGIQPSQLANPDLRFEETLQTTLGLDFSFFSGRLGGTVAVYQKNTDGLLLSRPLPETSGFSSFTENIGTIENRGIEFALNTVNIDTDNFTWSTSFNVSSNQNEVTSLGGASPFSVGFAGRITEGESIGAFYGYVADGLFRSEQEVENHAFQNDGTAPGDIRFKDLNDDGVINDEDRRVVGNPQPSAYGGLGNNIQWGGLTLDFQFQFSLGGEIFDNTSAFMGGPGGFFSTYEKYEDRYREGNTDTDIPRATLSDPNNNGRNSSYYVEDGSYARLKTLRLGYDVANLLDSFGGSVRNAEVFVIGKNLLTFTGYPGLDPEINYAGSSNTIRGQAFFTQPQSRVIRAGVSVGL